MKKLYPNFLSQQEIATKFDEMEKTDGDKSHLYADNVFVLEVFPQAKPFLSYSSRHSYRTDPRVHIVKILDEYG